MRHFLFAAALGLSSVFAAPAFAEVGPDGIHTEDWFKQSFLEMRPDLEEATEAGKRLVVIFEQEGCIYCRKIHEQVLSDPWVADYIKEHFDVVQMNLFGAREVVDFDGETMPESELAMRWGVLFTPTVAFFPEVYDEEKGGDGKAFAIAMMPGAFGKVTFRNMFEWIATKQNETEPNFQKFHMRRINELRAEGRLD